MDDELDFQDPETVMREARARFIEAFPGRVRSITILFNAMNSPDGGDPSHSTARRLAHQMAGIAGTLGFPGASQNASDLEQLLIAASSGQAGVGPEEIQGALAQLSDSFANDMAKPEPSWAKAPEHSAAPLVLLVAGDDDRRKVMIEWLREAGYQVAATGDGREAFTQARIGRPAAVIVDVDVPGVDGHSICRKIKVSPDIANTPVIFMTANASASDRVIGAVLGPDDYLTKPVDQTELTRRLGRVIKVRATQQPEAIDGVLIYEALALAAQDLLRRSSAAVALVRLPNGQEAAAASAIAAASRRSDLIAMLDARHALWLFPGGTAAVARSAVDSVAKNWPDLRSGIAAAAPGTRSLEAFVAEADQELNGGQTT